ncbi:class I SAM-dependent methyltransferase [bacterium]|nr:class I SAM-dependent methyltransferase [bacterium]
METTNEINLHLTNIEEILKTTGVPVEGNCVYLHQTYIRSEKLKPKQRNLMMVSGCGRKILEIGFNAGHSCLFFLVGNPNVTIQVFDLGNHPYSRPCFEYLNNAFPGRLSIIWGDSTTTVAKFSSQKKFDIIHIDGGHRYDVVRRDFDNCRRFAHANTLVIADDIDDKDVSRVCAELELTDVHKIFEPTDVYPHKLCRYPRLI